MTQREGATLVPLQSRTRSITPTRLEATTNSQKTGPNPYREKRQDGQHTGCEIHVGRECGKARGQLGADDAWNDKHESKEGGSCAE